MNAVKQVLAHDLQRNILVAILKNIIEMTPFSAALARRTKQVPNGQHHDYHR